jgi:hypothetical protein
MFASREHVVAILPLRVVNVAPGPPRPGVFAMVGRRDLTPKPQPTGANPVSWRQS